MSSLEKEIKQSNFANESVKANLNILYTANWLHNKISKLLKPFDLTHEQFNVLRILRGSHPKSMCQKDILSRMLAKNSNLTLIIKKLVSKGLIKVGQSQIDKREYKINILNSGLKKLKELDQKFIKKRFNDINLNESEAFHLNALLDKIRISEQ